MFCAGPATRFSPAAAANERKVAPDLSAPETPRRHLRAIPITYPKQETEIVRRRIYVFTLSLMTFLAVSAPALANGNWGR